MRLTVTLALLFIASLAHAQVGADGGSVANAWEDFQTQVVVIENTSTQDCAVACKALESLARATQHICDVAPEHCEEAKAKLAAMANRVHAACPQCEIRAESPPPPLQTGGVTVATSESVHSSGGCADCTTSGGTPDATLAILAALLLLKKKKTRA
jgi:hypothetical protein